MLSEFKEFINRGNFVELAVAFVMGLAVANAIDAIVNRTMLPLVAWVFGEPNFDHLLTFNNGAGSFGAIITAVVNFLIVALVLFVIVMAYNRMRRAQAEVPEPEADPAEVALLREIRDALVTPSGTTPAGGPSGDAR